MQVIGLIIIFSGIVLLESPRLIKQKMWGELMAFSGLLIFSIILSFAAALDIALPNPTAALEAVFGPPAKLLISLLK